MSMIKKLRIKFIRVSILSVCAVLIIIIGSINLFNYRQIIQNSDRILNIIKDVDNNPPKENEAMLEDIYPEASYQIRFFTVLVDKDEQIISTNTDKIISIDTIEAQTIAQEVLGSSSQSGFYANYRFVKEKDGTNTRITFLYCAKELSNFYSFFTISIFVSLIGLVLVLILLIIFSKKITQPFVTNYERQKQFITDASHELKTPLTIIKADNEIIETEHGENEWTNDIHLQVERLTHLTNDLILLARYEEENNTIVKSDFSLSETLSKITNSFVFLAQIQRKELQIDIMPQITFFGDSQAISQLISILLDNALKYSESGGIISVSLRKIGKRIHITVFNTTCYISKQTICHLFERFYRADSSHNSKTGGHGIGMAIAKAIVQSHHGTISASTKDEKSLSITIIF